jgi:hypothetical protein
VRTRFVTAFALTMMVALVTLALAPVALISMGEAMWGQGEARIYDLFTGQQVDANEPLPADAAFVNLTATDLDEGTRVVSLTVSGHRVCGAVCPPITGTFFSLGSDAERRRGLPPSAELTVPGESGTYTFSIQLPVRGTPQRYPFDDYTLLLGLVVSSPRGDRAPAVANDPAIVSRNVLLTLEDQVPQLNMAPPVPVDPESVRSPSDPVTFLLVDRLEWSRPLYLRILTVILVVLISASGVFALGMRTLGELVLGIGGIILGIWGVRSVVVQTPLPDVTLIDVILGFVILMMLLGLTLRAARHFFNLSGLRGWRGNG